MNSSVQETIGRFFPSIFNMPGSDSRVRASAIPSNVPTRAALQINPRYATYYRHLSLEGHGTPLWLPEPNENQHINYRRQGAAIGDVVLFTENGGLQFLFNICLDAHDPINGDGVPEGFTPFTPALLPRDVQRFHEYAEGECLASKSITKERNLQGPAGLWFKSSASEGAILTMPEGAYSESLVRVSRFDQYLADNLDSWYKYVENVRHWKVEQGELHLVTGVHKAKAWGMAAFSNETTTAMDLHMIFKSNQNTSSGDLYSWEYEGVVDSTRTGPTRQQRRNILAGLPEAAHELFENQCLFVRTVSGMVQKLSELKECESRSGVVPTSRMKTNTSLDNVGSARPSDSSSSRSGSNEMRGTSVLEQLGAQDDLSIMRNSPVLRDHPSKAINDFLLKDKPNGKIAITHDEDWISLLSEDDVSLPSGDEMVARLKKLYKVIENNGIISLEYRDLRLDTTARSLERLPARDQFVQDGIPQQPERIAPVGFIDSITFPATHALGSSLSTATGNGYTQKEGDFADATPTVNKMLNQLQNMTISRDNFMQRSDKISVYDLLLERVAGSAMFDSAERIDPPKCLPGTRVAILEEIFTWITNSGHRDEWLLWLNGSVGSGKSAIFQSILERCSMEGMAVASFFFLRSDPIRNSMKPLVATLVWQLMQCIPETSNDIFSTIEKNPIIFSESLESQLQQLLIQPLLRLPARLQRLFVVFIDGLDECIDVDQNSYLIRVLCNILNDRNAPVLVLISSRREFQISAEFSRQRKAKTLITYSLDAIQASDDIQLFLNAAFEEMKWTHMRKYLPPDWPPSGVIEQIVTMSSGHFLYASTFIKYISSPRGDPQNHLEIIQGIRPRKSFSQNPFAQLDALYQYIFSQVKELDVVLEILAFNLATANAGHHMGCEIRTLEALFQLEPGELEVLFADLAPILRYETHDSIIACESLNDAPGFPRITFLHASVPDFLLDVSRSQRYFINLDKYVPHLLHMFLERSPPRTYFSFSTDGSKPESNLKLTETTRLYAISLLLTMAKASGRLQFSCMNFNYVFFSSKMLSDNVKTTTSILHSLKKLDFEDKGQAYHHFLHVFAVGLAKYWPSIDDDVKNEMLAEFPDLVALINRASNPLSTSDVPGTYQVASVVPGIVR